MGLSENKLNQIIEIIEKVAKEKSLEIYEMEGYGINGWCYFEIEKNNNEVIRVIGTFRRGLYVEYGDKTYDNEKIQKKINNKKEKDMYIRDFYDQLFPPQNVLWVTVESLEELEKEIRDAF